MTVLLSSWLPSSVTCFCCTQFSCSGCISHGMHHVQGLVNTKYRSGSGENKIQSPCSKQPRSHSPYSVPDWATFRRTISNNFLYISIYIFLHPRFYSGDVIREASNFVIQLTPSLHWLISLFWHRTNYVDLFIHHINNTGDYYSYVFHICLISVVNVNQWHQPW